MKKAFGWFGDFCCDTLKKLVAWGVCYFLSVLIEYFGFAKQEVAFLIVHLGIANILIFLLIIISTSASELKERTKNSFKAIVMYFVIVARLLFASWCVTKFFNVEFGIAYQIITFSDCFILENKTNNA